MVRLALPGRIRLSTALTGAAAMLVVVVATALLTAGSSARTGPMATAKPFTLDRLGDPGSQIALSDYAGRPVIINFFASWCGPCQKETPLIARFYRSHHGQVVIIGIDANDQAGAALKFLRAQGVRYPVAFDPSASVTVSYGIMALPQTLFLNARHQIVRHIRGAVTLAELDSWAASLPHQNRAN